MDDEQARFILSSFRPDGADVHDPDFAAALELALANRELGEWLAHQRAFDAKFASGLAALPLPPNLRADIDACLTGFVGETQPASDSNDVILTQALAEISPPPMLRNELIAAMKQTAAAQFPVQNRWKKYALPLAAAAGIALAFLFTRGEKSAAVTQQIPLRAEIIPANFIRSYESPWFRLDEKRTDHQSLVKHLEQRGLPWPSALPEALKRVPSIGCKKLIINGVCGSVICFNETANGIIHLVIFRREDVVGDMPTRCQAHLSQEGRWAAARWQEGDKVFFLLGISDTTKLARLL